MNTSAFTADKTGFENMGKPWKEEEIAQLLSEVAKKLSISDIASNHKRTMGGIRARLREMAAEYYIDDEMPIEQIIKLTGLSEQDIADAIERRIYRNECKKEKDANKETKRGAKKEDANKCTQEKILESLNDIKNLLSKLEKKIEGLPPTQ